MQLPDRLVYLFNRYMKKTYTPGELDELMEYINNGQYDAQIQELMDQGWDLPLPVYEQHPDKASAIFNNIIEQGATRRKSYKRPLFFIKYMAAAMILSAIGLGIYYYSRPTVINTQVAAQSPTATLTAHQYLSLPDGSKVLLNAGSHLTYADSFGNTREVHLSGEAYFDIRHNNTRPFIVYAGNIKTVVLGTAFDIKAFPGAPDVTVTVTRGKVRVEKDQQVAGILSRNEQITVNEKDNTIKKAIVNIREAIAWKEEDIILDDVELNEVVKELAQRFKCTISFNQPALGRCRVTASFLHHETLEQIIQVITRINHMDYRLEPNNTILISGPGCN